MTNYGNGYIFAAVPFTGYHEGWLRLLCTLETFPADKDGWRKVGVEELARQACMHRSTVKTTRADLIDAKLIEYQAGRGNGVLSRWKILIPPLDKGSPVEPFSGEAKRVQVGRQKGSGTPVKGFRSKPDNTANNAGQTPDFAANGHAAALSAKAEALKAGGFSSAEPYGPAVTAATAGGSAAVTDIRERQEEREFDQWIWSRMSLDCREGRHHEDCTSASLCECDCHGGDCEEDDCPHSYTWSPFRKQFRRRNGREAIRGAPRLTSQVPGDSFDAVAVDAPPTPPDFVR